MKYFGQFSPPLDKFIYERYFKFYNNSGVLIECGAFDGITESSCCLFESMLGWKSINIEAAPTAFKALVENRPHSLNLNVALSDTCSTMPFKLVYHPTLGANFGNSSIQHCESHMDELKNIGCTFEDVFVEAITYDRMLEITGITSLDLFVLDIEGHEMAVLHSMKKTKTNILPTIFVVEHGHLGIDTIKSTIEPLGYIYDTSLHVNSFFVRRNAGPHIMRAISEYDSYINNQEIECLRQQLDRELEIKNSLSNEVRLLRSSRSWKVTHPLRVISKILTKLTRSISE